jgi:hypothetical protein
MSWGLKLAVTLVHPYILEHHPPFSPYLLPCGWKKRKMDGKRRKRGKKEIGRNIRISNMLPSLPP